MKISATGELAGRAIPEWKGKTADTPIPDRVKLRVVLRYGRKDAITGEPLRKGWHMDHKTPLKDWIATPEYPHGNVEHNLQPVNAMVNTTKAAKENTARVKVTDIQKKVLHIHKPKTQIRSAPFFKAAKPKGNEAHIAAMAAKGKRIPPPRFT